MRNNKMLGIALWGIGLAVECLLLFCSARTYSVTVWITFGFTLFTFISQLIMWLFVWRTALNADESFLHMPLFILSLWYMILQAIPCLLFAFWKAPIQVVVLVNMALSVVMWILLIMSMMAKNYIKRVDSRQIDHHIID